MAGWDSVPWFVGGGAMHSPEVARVLAYVALSGNEGILSPTDLKVRALAVPGGSVTVDPGAAAILCRATGQLHQAYAGRLASQDAMTIAPTSAGAGRSDLVVARVEDPYLAGEPWADPEDPASGPYIFTRIIAGVPATTTTLAQLNLGYSAIPLARVDIPASTGTITQAMITDLRRVANPRRDRHLDIIFPTTTTAISSGWTDWRTVATSRSFAVPAWATQAVITADLSGMAVRGNATVGRLRVATAGTAAESTIYDEAWSGNTVRCHYTCAGELTLPAGTAGTQQTVRVEAVWVEGSGRMEIDTGTTIHVDVEFREVAE